jgi:hypothetical protein
MNQGPGWSPDGGYFWVRGSKMYWEDGDVWELKPGKAPVIRLAVHKVNCEDFSKWSDEKRRATLAARKAEIEENRRRENRALARRDALVYSARKKITKDEFDAVVSLGFD